MSSAPAPAVETGSVRPLTPADFERIVEIDRELSGFSRRGFFEKRLRSAETYPKAFVPLGYEEDGALEGFVMAHMLDGEFGGSEPAGILDAIGTTPRVRGHGGARALLGRLIEKLKRRGAKELRTQLHWREQPLIQFFAAAGFELSPRVVLDRTCARQDREIAPGEVREDGQDDLPRDRVPVRTLQAADLPAVVAIDRRITGRDRTAYYRHKFDEVLNGTGIRLSMIATADETSAGFIMARVDYGEFGMAQSEAVIDTIGVDPELRGRDIASALLAVLLGNLESLRVDSVRTEVPWNSYGLLAFLEARGFRPSQRLDLTRAL
ncbi:MAG: GNAT family N-acetyltransferase [Rhodomicrobium sp.]